MLQRLCTREKALLGIHFEQGLDQGCKIGRNCKTSKECFGQGSLAAHNRHGKLLVLKRIEVRTSRLQELVCPRILHVHLPRKVFAQRQAELSVS